MILGQAAAQGFSPERCSDIGIALTEAGTNLLKHGGGGEVLLRIIPTGIELLVVDKGSGRDNIEECMRDGYTTSGSSGTGLGAMKRLASNFDIYSRSQQGTLVMMDFSINDQATDNSGAVSLAVEGEILCGDGWDIIRQSDRTLLLIADGLGHGPDAHRAAVEASRVFHENQQRSPGAILEAIHLALRSTRGAAVTVAAIDTLRNVVHAAGVGNCCVTVLRPGYRRSLISMNGTAGEGVVKAKEFSNPWEPNDTLLMHSDGLLTRWDVEKYPGLLHRHPSLLAGALYRDFARGRDDLTVVAVRMGNSAGMSR